MHIHNTVIKWRELNYVTMQYAFVNHLLSFNFNKLLSIALGLAPTYTHTQKCAGILITCDRCPMSYEEVLVFPLPTIDVRMSHEEVLVFSLPAIDVRMSYEDVLVFSLPAIDVRMSYEEVLVFSLPAIDVRMSYEDVSVDGDGENGEEGDGNQAVPENREQLAQHLAVHLPPATAPSSVRDPVQHGDRVTRSTLRTLLSKTFTPAHTYM